jgi:hypothetical protein
MTAIVPEAPAFSRLGHQAGPQETTNFGANRDGRPERVHLILDHFLILNACVMCRDSRHYPINQFICVIHPFLATSASSSNPQGLAPRESGEGNDKRDTRANAGGRRTRKLFLHHRRIASLVLVPFAFPLGPPL